MFGSFILDVAVGMVFIYLLLSLVASGVNEILASIVQSRAANLQRGLRSLFSGDSIEAGAVSLVDNIYNHGLIRGLYQDPAKDYGGTPSKWTELRLKCQRWLRVAPAKQIDGVSDPLLLPAYIPARTFALALIDILNKDKFNGKTPLENIEDFLSNHQQQFAKNKAVEAILALVIDAKNDVKDEAKRLQKLQSNLEDWYNDAMDRVSGWYKRYTQNLLMIVGLILAIAFNVNSISIAHLLWVDRDIRDGMVAAATDYLKDHPNPVASSAQPAQSPSEEEALVHRMESSVQAVNDVTTKYMVPVGWRYSLRDYLWGWEHRTRSMIRIAIVTLAGWLITAGALSLGASFWFDMLNKIMVVRSTVKPEEKSQPEASKD